MQYPGIVFMGSPDFAIPTLQALIENYHLIGVVTQPDRPAGRGKVLTAPPVKELAESQDIPVLQPVRLREPSAVEALGKLGPDLIVVAAFGQILPKSVLDMPTFGCLNVHASLLPRWRGAAPIQAAILHGDEKTGITIMKMDPGLDTGPIITTAETQISPKDTGASLSSRLAELGAETLLKALPGYLAGELKPRPQDDALATYAGMIKKSDAELDFSQPAEQLARAVRAYHPWPGAYTFWEGTRLKILAAHAVTGDSPGPGLASLYEDMPAIGTGQGLLVLDELQPASKKAMSGTEFLRGSRSWGS